MPRVISTLSFKKKTKIREQLFIEDANYVFRETESLPQDDNQSEIPETNQEATVVSSESSNSDSHEVTVTSDLPTDENETKNTESITNNSLASSKSNSLTIDSNRKSINSSSNLAYYNLFKDVNWKSFWDIDGYEPVLKRCDDGYILGSDLAKCLHERAAINQKHFEDIYQWKKHWLKKIKNEDYVEYGGCKDAWCELLETEEKLAKKQSEVSLSYKKYSTDVSEWLKKNYQKHVIHFNQQKMFLEDFKGAQKDWKHALQKLDRNKNEHESLCKKYGNEAKEEIKSRKDNLIRNCEQQIQLLNYFVPNYKKGMIDAFEFTQRLERLRKKEFKRVFSNWLNSLKTQVISDNIIKSDKLEKYDPEQDLLWYSNNYGPGMEFIMPSLLN